MKISRRWLSTIAALMLGLAGCSDGHRSAPGTTAARGAVVKGPVQGAQVQLFALDEGGFATGEALQTLMTDASGRFSFSRPTDGPALLAVTRGGSFVDESDPQTDITRKRRITLNTDQGFESVLPAGATTLVVTPYTEALLLMARRAANGANFPVFFDAVRSRAVDAFGFDPFSVIPEPPLSPDAQASPASRRYALLLGGAALGIQSQASALGVVPSYATVRAFIEDFSDGRLDGQLNQQPISPGGTSQILPNDVVLAQAVTRFRNNHFAKYSDVEASSVDEGQLAAPLDVDNQAPLARPDAFNAVEDTALIVQPPGVLENDIDSENQTLTVTLVSDPEFGALTLNADGSFSYTPNDNFNGTDSFTYRASDGALPSSPVTVSLNISPVDDAPSAVNDEFTTDEDTVLEIAALGILANDSDAEDNDLSAALVSGPASGMLTLNADGSFSYTPNANFNGTDTFTYQVSDGTSNSAPATVTLNVTAINDAPVAVNDDYVSEVNTPLSIPEPGVLINDSDVDNATLTAVLVQGPNNGALTLSQDGSFIYTPTDEPGLVTFTYRVSDGSSTLSIATVSISINQSNQPPQAFNDVYSLSERSVLVVPSPDNPSLLANDSDPDSEFSLIDSTPTQEGDLGRGVFVDDFANDQQGLDQTSLVNWSVSNASSVDVFEGEFGFPSQSKLVDLDGGFNTGARLASEIIPLTPGVHVLAFVLGNNTVVDLPNFMTVSVAGVEVGQFSRQGSQAPSRVSCYVELPPTVEQGRIVFDHSQTPGDDSGLLISDVQLYRLNNANESLPPDGSFVFVAPIFNPEAEEPPPFSGATSFSYTIADDLDPAATSSAVVDIVDWVPGECGKLTLLP